MKNLPVHARRDAELELAQVGDLALRERERAQQRRAARVEDVERAVAHLAPHAPPPRRAARAARDAAPRAADDYDDTAVQVERLPEPLDDDAYLAGSESIGQGDETAPESADANRPRSH